MTGRLKDKVPIVLGAGSAQGAPDRPPIGNGKAAAIVYAREGAEVVEFIVHPEFFISHLACLVFPSANSYL